MPHEYYMFLRFAIPAAAIYCLNKLNQGKKDKYAKTFYIVIAGVYNPFLPL